ncbi:MAG: PaaI family thioesterase, partial [Candidatus Binataceae bacterium]
PKGPLEAIAIITHNRSMARTPREEYPALATLEDGPFSTLLGLKVEEAAAGVVTVRMPFNLQLLNFGPPDVPIHGGAIATLADFAACAAVWTLPQTQRSATISMSLNYTAPAVRSDLVARATVRRAGRRVASLSVEIRDRSDALVADGLITYKIA